MNRETVASGFLYFGLFVSVIMCWYIIAIAIRWQMRKESNRVEVAKFAKERLPDAFTSAFIGLALMAGSVMGSPEIRMSDVLPIAILAPVLFCLRFLTRQFGLFD